MAADPAKTEARRAELARMAEVLAHVATQPARDLYDALQLVWLTALVLQHESNASSISLGRMDQYLLPYYRASRDASNELSLLLLDIQNDTRLPQPNLSLRVHKDTPDDLYLKAAQVISLGDGLPQVFNDEVNIEAFRRRGISQADARDYAVVGCVELSIPGRMYCLHDISMFSLLKCYEICLREHPEGFADFEDLCRGVEQVIDRYIALMVEGCNTCDLAHRAMAPTPLLSTLVHDSLDRGADIIAGGARYNPSDGRAAGRRRSLPHGRPRQARPHREPAERGQAAQRAGLQWVAAQREVLPRHPGG